MKKTLEPHPDKCLSVNCDLAKVYGGPSHIGCVKRDLARLSKIKHRELKLYKDKVIIRSEQILNEIFQSFAIKNRGNLKSFDIKFSTKARKRSDRNLEVLGLEITRTFSDLRDLTFGFESLIGKESFSDEGLGVFITQISRQFIFLKRLTLIFEKNRKITDVGIRLLGSEISNHLFDLEKLSLQFKYCEHITTDGMIFLVSKISKRLINIKQLSLNFQGSSSMTLKALGVILPKIAKGLVKLRELSLNFPIYKVEDNGVETIVPGLTQYPLKLQSFSIEVWSLHLTDNNISALGLAIAIHLSGLKELSLHLSPCSEITDEGLGALGLQVARLASLRKLSLKFLGDKMTATHITDRGVQDFVYQLTNDLINLEDLSLDLPYSQITDLSIKTIGTEISKRLTRLRSLSFNFEACDNITNEAIELFVEEIVSQLALKEFTLHLCPSVTNTSLQILIDKVCKELTGLRKLCLSFFCCYEITDEIHSIAIQIANCLLNLEELTLIFEDETVSHECMRDLNEILRLIPNLTIE